MSNNFKHGDIFYVDNGHWFGLYTDKNVPKIIVYKEELTRVVQLKDFTPLKYGERIIEIEENYLDDIKAIILGNIFKLAEEAVIETKNEYDQAEERCANVEDLISVKDRRFVLDMGLGGNNL